ncbi:MAG: hypothetical protein WA133_07875 [Syntrophales bacterium]
MKAEEKDGREDVIVLDEGMVSEGIIGPLASCCGSVLIPLFWS